MLKSKSFYLDGGVFKILYGDTNKIYVLSNFWKYREKSILKTILNIKYLSLNNLNSHF